MEHAAVPSYVREQRMTHWVEAYSDDIQKVCYIYLADRTQAEDALQETFLKAWKNMTAYERKGIANDKAWLMRIAVNICKDYHRTGWFRHIDKRADMDSLLAGRAGHDVQASADHELAMDICRLPEKFKQVILLYYYQEMNIREVAHALGIPSSTVQRRLKKAETMLKSVLMGGEDDDG